MTIKKGIFISHIHEEHALGEIVKNWITDAFGGFHLTAFLSSNHRDMPAGTKWLEKVERELSESGVMISLLSPTSLARPWVNIELGATWIMRVPIIPLCHSGQTIEALPRPFSDFNGVDLARDDAAKRLMGGVADVLELQHPKGLHWEECLRQMRTAAAESRDGAVVAAAEVATNTLPRQQIDILQLLSKWENNARSEELPGDGAAMLCGLKETEFKYHSRELVKAGLIHIDYYADGTKTYKNTPDGAGWLIKNNLMPE
jgi:hypothetical protein